jgi:hypothetical protein
VKISTELINILLGYEFGDKEGWKIIENDIVNVDLEKSMEYRKYVLEHPTKGYYAVEIAETPYHDIYELNGDNVDAKKVKPVQKTITVYK